MEGGLFGLAGGNQNMLLEFYSPDDRNNPFQRLPAWKQGMLAEQHAMDRAGQYGSLLRDHEGERRDEEQLMLDVLGTATPFGGITKQMRLLQNLAKKRYKTTRNPEEAGYITPDGSMLDFTGKHLASKDNWPYMGGHRSIDHRDIDEVVWDKIGDPKKSYSGNEVMRLFMNEGGMVRYKGAEAGAEVQVMPTDSQIKTIVRNARVANEPLYIDVSNYKTGGLAETLEFARPNVPQVKERLQGLLDKGIILPNE